MAILAPFVLTYAFSAATTPATPPTEPKPGQQLCFGLRYGVEEGTLEEYKQVRQQPKPVVEASRDTVDLLLHIGICDEVAKDSKGNITLKCDIKGGEFTVTRTRQKGLGESTGSVENAAVDGLSFMVTIASEKVTATIDKACLPTLRRNWHYFHRQKDQDALSWNKGYPLLEKILPEACQQWFYFVHADTTAPLPETWTWVLPVRSDFDKHLGKLTMSAKPKVAATTDKPVEPTQGRSYQLEAKYQEVKTKQKKPVAVDLGVVGTCDVKVMGFKDVRLPAEYKLETKARVVGVPDKGQGRFHNKHLTVGFKLVDADELDGLKK